jgi:5'-3' exonuclease
MLDYMGVAVIRSPCGEAEKACAYLNLVGKCDGVISEDSDVFLYGAKTVYRNFCIDKKVFFLNDNGSNELLFLFSVKTEISIEEYTMSEIESKLGYNREMLVALALFLGCDYDTKGVPGCGVQMANKFLNEIIELEKKQNRKINVLNLIRNWQSSEYKSCGIISEDKIRKIVCSSIEQIFPNEKIIREYLFIEENHRKILVNEFDFNFKWRRPNLKLCQVCCFEKSCKNSDCFYQK